MQPPAQRVMISLLKSCFFAPTPQAASAQHKTTEKVLFPAGQQVGRAGPAELLTAAPPPPSRRAPAGPEESPARPRRSEGTCSPLATSSPARRARPPLPPQRGTPCPPSPRRTVRLPSALSRSPQAARAPLTILRARNRPTATARAPTTETSARRRLLLLLTGLRTPLHLRGPNPASRLSSSQSASLPQPGRQHLPPPSPPTGSGKVQGSA